MEASIPHEHLFAVSQMGAETSIEHTVCIKKFLNTWNMVNSGIVHYQYAKWTWKG